MDADHHIAYLVLVGIDITARKRAEAELHALIAAIPHLVWTGRPDGYVDYYNQRWRDYTGLSTEEVQREGCSVRIPMTGSACWLCGSVPSKRARRMKRNSVCTRARPEATAGS